MNQKMKRRMIAVAGVIVIVVIVLLAVVGGGSSASVIDVSAAASGDYEGKKVQVTGTVVDNSYSVDADGVLTFAVADEADEAQATQVPVSYDKGVSATFGNGITAICTGHMQGGVLVCTELVTKCPSKYENASTALSVDELLAYDADAMVGNTVKVTGTVVAGSVADANAPVRLVVSGNDGATLNIIYSGALSDEVADGASVVVTGALTEEGDFLATEVALEG